MRVGEALAGGSSQPLIGRDAELAEVRRGLTLAEPSSFVIAGSAGLGKSSLVRAMAASVATAGREILHVIATPTIRAVPFGALAPVIPDVDADASVATVLQQASAAIARRVPRERPLLVVDDAHTLDDCSATLLLLLVRTRVCPALVTVRTPSPVPDDVTA